MLTDDMTLNKNSTPDAVVFTKVKPGENATLRKDISGTYADQQSLNISQSYNESTNVRRALIRFDRTPDPTEALPDPKQMSAYIVLQFEDTDHPDAIADMTEQCYLLSTFLGSSAYVSGVLNGEH